jgi:hypothetical protein
MQLVGATPFGLRLPSLLAVGAALAVFFGLFNRRLGPAYAWAVVLLVLLVSGYHVSFEERGYAVLILCFALALNAWDRLGTDGPSLRHEITFVLSLAAAVWAHYYGAFYFIAFLGAAVMQAWHRRRLGWRPFAGLALAGVLCLPLVPLAAVASQYSSGFWTGVSGNDAIAFYPELLRSVTPCLVLMAVAATVGLATERQAEEPGPPSGLPAHTMYALAATACLPVPMFVAARLVTGAFHPKYIVASGLALCLIVVALAPRLRLARRTLFVTLIVIPGLSFALAAGRQVRGLQTSRYADAQHAALVHFQDQRPEPVVIGDDADFVQLAYAAGDALTNTYFLYDAFPDRRTNVDRAVPGLRLVMPIPAMPYAQMIDTHREFVVVAGNVPPVIQRATADGAIVTVHFDAGIGQRYWSVRYPDRERD